MSEPAPLTPPTPEAPAQYAAPAAAGPVQYAFPTAFVPVQYAPPAVSPVPRSRTPVGRVVLGWAQFVGGAAAVLATALPWAATDSRSIDGFDHGAWAVIVIVLGVAVAVVGVITMMPAARRLPAGLQAALAAVLGVVSAVALLDWQGWIGNQNEMLAELTGGLDRLASELGGSGSLGNFGDMFGQITATLSLGYGLWVLVGAAALAFLAALVQSVLGHGRSATGA